MLYTILVKNLSNLLYPQNTFAKNLSTAFLCLLDQAA